ncbi:hypothetical protein ACWGJW_36090 [Streptomyces nigrescens]
MTGGSDKFAELLRRAGLDIVGDRRTEEVLPPRAAWRPVIAFEAEPAVAVQIDRPDVVAELNTQWHRLAVKEGIMGEDGVFLIDVAGNGTGCVPRGWTRVRLTARWNLAGVLGERPGQPEFRRSTPGADGSSRRSRRTGAQSSPRPSMNNCPPTLTHRSAKRPSVCPDFLRAP